MKLPRIGKAGAFLGLDFLYVAILIILMIGRQAHWLQLDRIHNPIGGIIPLAVPWFGALGAVTISIYGVVNNSDRWQDKWNLWHLARPVVGAILGTVAFLIFIGIIQATGTTPSVAGSTSGSASVKLITYLVIAFVVGFREQTFRTLITRVVDILLSPGDSAKAPALSVSPSPLAFGDVTAGQTKTLPMTIASEGTDALVVQKGSATPPGLGITGEGFTLADEAVQGATVNPGASVIINVVFSPQRAEQYNATLTINCNAGLFPISLIGTGT